MKRWSKDARPGSPTSQGWVNAAAPSLNFSDVWACVDSLGCDAVKFYGFFLACTCISIYDFEPWGVDYDSLVNFEELIDNSVYVLWAIEDSGLDDV